MRTKHDLKTERSCRYKRAKHDRKQAIQKQITTRTKTKRLQDKTWKQTMTRYENRGHKIVDQQEQNLTDNEQYYRETETKHYMKQEEDKTTETKYTKKTRTRQRKEGNI